MKGFIPVYKEKGPSSHKVARKAANIVGDKSAGHTGTLDPEAGGVLVVMLGRATKLLDYLPQDKSYTATFKLGIKTDTADLTGKVLEQKEVKVKKDDVINILPSFLGETQQLPPMYSAVKSDGVPLYKLARRGIEKERKARRITIYGIELTKFDEENNIYEIDVSCSKGTYIRTLCEDIGEKLGCGAAMVSLVRTKANNFDVKECFTLEQIEEAVKNNKLGEIIKSPECVFSYLPKIIVPEDGKKYYLNGGFIDEKRFETPLNDSLYRVYDSYDIFLGLGEKQLYNNEIGLKSVWQAEM